MVNQLVLLEHIRSHLKDYVGMTTDELISRGAFSPTGKPINKKAKQHRYNLALWMAAVNRDRLSEQGIQIKTVRLNSNGRPVQDMSVDQFKFMGPGGLIEQDWDSAIDEEAAQIKRVFQKPIVFVIFVDGENASDDGQVKFEGSVLWKMPTHDLEGTVRQIWERTNQAIVNGGVPRDLPRSNVVEDKMFFVRTYGTKGITEKTPKNGPQPIHGFYLGKDYVKEQIAKSREKCDSGWPELWEVIGVDEELISAEQELETRGSFDISNLSDNRKQTVQAVVQRRGQGIFRQELLEAYGGKCAVTGYSSTYALEACHIIPYLGDETNIVNNGLLLRADIHTLFDLGKIAIDSNNMTVVLSPELLNTEYVHLNNKNVSLPQDSAKKPDASALNQHRELHGL